MRDVLRRFTIGFKLPQRLVVHERWELQRPALQHIQVFGVLNINLYFLRNQLVQLHQDVLVSHLEFDVKRSSFVQLKHLLHSFHHRVLQQHFHHFLALLVRYPG